MANIKTFELFHLPTELIAYISLFLPLDDLGSFRLASKDLARIGLDALRLCMPSEKILFWPSHQQLLDLILFAQNSSTADILKALQISVVDRTDSQLLSRIHLSSLTTLEIGDTTIASRTFVDFLTNHALTLHTLSLSDVKLLLSSLEMGRVSGWTTVLKAIGSNLHLNKIDIYSLRYVLDDFRSTHVDIATIPEKRCGHTTPGSGQVDEYQDGAFIDENWAEGHTVEAVLRVCDAFVDDQGREMFRNKPW